MSNDIVATGEADMTSLKAANIEPDSSAVAAPVGMTAVDFRVRRSQVEEQSQRPQPAQEERLASDDLPFNLGAYTLEGRLGQGAMASVYVARHRLLGHHCAVKLLRPEYEADPRVRERFLREGRVLASLQHSNLVRVHDLVEPQGVEPGYLVMELLQGETLEDRIARGRLPLVEALDYATQMASALIAVHGTGIAHRDLKPANIFLAMDADGCESVKILDFGIAKGLAGTATHGTRPGALIGTPAYMAPEQVLGEEVDHRVDVYQLGLVLWEMLCGNLPCDDRNLPEILVWHTTQQKVALPPHVPREVSEIVQGCLQVDRMARWPSMREVRHKLDRAPRLRLPSGEFVQRSQNGLHALARRDLAPKSPSAVDSFYDSADIATHSELTSRFEVASGSWLVFFLSLIGFVAAVGAAGWLAITPAVGPMKDNIVPSKHRPVFKNVGYETASAQEDLPSSSTKELNHAPSRLAKTKSAIEMARPRRVDLAESPERTDATVQPKRPRRTAKPDDGRTVSRSTTKSPF